MDNSLVKDEKFGGRFVALKSFDDKTVIDDGKDPKEVLEKANKKGYKTPVIFYVPIKDMVQIY
jgi:hypothetical protein